MRRSLCQVAVARTLEAVAPGERFDVWTSWNSNAFAPVTHRPFAGQELWGVVWDDDLGSIGIRRVLTGPHVLNRSSTDVAAEDPEMVWLTVQLRGRSVITRGGHTRMLKPGDMTLQDSSSPFTTLYPEPVDVGVFQIPRRLLRLPAAALSETGVRSALATTASELVFPLLTRLAQQLSADAVPQNREDLGEAVINLVRVVYARPDAGATSGCAGQPSDTTVAAPRSSPGRGAANLLTALKASIERSLDDPTLSAESIANRHHISVRYLYRLFEADGAGVAGWIRMRRLERCRRDLADRALQSLTVADISRRWGFRSAAHFSRAFRTTYGSPPGTYRDNAHARHISPPILTGRVRDTAVRP